MVNPQIKLMLTIEKQSSRTMAKAFTFIVIFCVILGHGDRMGMAYCTSWCSQDREEKSNQIWKSIGIRICGVGWDLCHGSCKDSSGEERRTENRRKLHCGMVTL
ncbi:uncharacterized protein AFUA_7G00900 [Aspergillus fumigatus Af293]|uniref:Uncharacterized protein n=1 Tax=Aspergillus fumigatus (strain ATCC MYA-4609 / CBS 101355 / FGSC A1100 / Af293) TaxID=330879 RepID=Q4WAD4_ASPFU|nr:hypothetical protein AFUA_7G00900 [Aspergillus fumigatus Af293]EAL84802.1 hypothetical protein AFUA_7G00900 [Aspergillus fumigatus Af293]